MQWCHRLEANYGMDLWIWQSLDGPSFCLSSKHVFSLIGSLVPEPWEYWLVHIVIPSMGLKTPSAPWVLSLAA